MENQNEQRPIHFASGQNHENIASWYLSKNEKTDKFHYEHMEPERMKFIFKTIYDKINSETIKNKISIALKTI